jgi:hypothetical protein
MTSHVPVLGLAPDFDEFLFAQIGEGKNGMLLSVLSVLARLDLDPWQEANSLAGLPRKTAADRLARLLASLPDEPTLARDTAAAAARLIMLLPRRAKSDFQPGPTGSAISAEKPQLTVAQVVIISAVLMTCLLGLQWISATRASGPNLDTAPAVSSSTLPGAMSSEFPR